MARLRALLPAIGGPLRTLRRRRDKANIRRLAQRLGCSIEDATRLYVLARQHGFGSAYAQVFGSVEPRTSGSAQSRQRAEDGDSRSAARLASRR